MKIIIEEKIHINVNVSIQNDILHACKKLTKHFLLKKDIRGLSEITVCTFKIKILNYISG